MGEASCPKATIVVPVYNSARSIQRCLDSLLAQSERSIQVVCVNDGSTDDSLNVLRQIAQADDHVLVNDQENAGDSCARNAGIDAAVGGTVFCGRRRLHRCATVGRVLHAIVFRCRGRRFWRRLRAVRRRA
ncbi:MAG: glycosyltransferase [Collinsella aerofaciens]